MEIKYTVGSVKFGHLHLLFKLFTENVSISLFLQPEDNAIRGDFTAKLSHAKSGINPKYFTCMRPEKREDYPSSVCNTTFEYMLNGI